VDIVTDLPAHPEPPEPVQQGEGLFHDPAVRAQARAVFGAAAGDHGRDALVPDLPAVLVVVVPPAGIDPVRALAGAAAAAAYRRDRLDQRH